MITIQAIINEIKSMLYNQYPSCTYYMQDIEQSIARPSFHIYLDTDRSEDAGISVTGEATSIGIVYYAPDDSSAPEELKRLKVYDSVKSLFRKGFISIGDRTLRVALIRGGKEQKELYLIVKLVYMEDRPVDAYGSVYELMNDIKIKTNQI